MAQPHVTGRRWRRVLVVLLVGAASGSAMQPVGEPPPLRLFFQAAADDAAAAREALEAIGASWKDGYTGIVWDLVRFTLPPREPPPRTAPFDRGPDEPAPRAELSREHPSTAVWRRLIAFLEDQTDLRLGRGSRDLDTIQQWMWSKPYDPHPEYAAFKGRWYGEIDPRFQDFFASNPATTIRLDEIDWGGVGVNGIPPLEYPRFAGSDEAGAAYLDDDHVVFGIAAGGETRAYPKRILAWHELAWDRLGGVELTIVYCTLCGTVIPYESMVDGRHVRFGTSGLLYRSNKLMFDHETKSLWNTFEGEPVVGPLVGSGLRLTHRSVVTTTWGEWRRTHPRTTVLTLETGHQRDYSEGAAYRDYFSSDEPMFHVRYLDDRLEAKEEVVVLLSEAATGPRQPLAIAVDFLEDHPVFHTRHAGRELVVVTSPAGANRVYRTAGQRFSGQPGPERVEDVTGGVWRVREDALVLESDPARRLPRVVAQRAFWFGWYAQFPNTDVIR